ncbi:12375_t:CDS:10 [Cetraspora pellucida]|uniref:12375_t:CDS:1 n=1 Tax=Cetraspora pellucida TaxID=1433469 RepID=A0A9N9CBN5_9GLOM|nr:12375_t:CDS:10 [Cetraspora pellucida]
MGRLTRSKVVADNLSFEKITKKGQNAEGNERTGTEFYLEIWNVIKNHRDSRNRPMAKLFNTLPDRRHYPDYYEEKKIDRKEYPDNESFESDLDLMFENAKKYNVEGSQIYNDAKSLQRLAHNLLGDKYVKTKEGSEMYKTFDKTEHNGETYNIGDYVHIINERDPDKPNVGHIFRIWKNHKGESGVNVCWYYHPEQTKHQVSKKFFENEVFKTNTFHDHSMQDVLGKCFVLQVKDYVKGRPKGSENKSVYVCESRYNEGSKVFNRIKNWHHVMPKGFDFKKIELDKYESPITLRKTESPLAAEWLAAHDKIDESQKLETSEFEQMSTPVSVSESVSASTTMTQTVTPKPISMKRQQTVNQSTDNLSPHPIVPSQFPPNIQPQVQPQYSHQHPMTPLNPSMMMGRLHGYGYGAHYQHPQPHPMLVSPQYVHPHHYPTMSSPASHTMTTQIPATSKAMPKSFLKRTTSIVSNNNASQSFELPSETTEHFARDDKGRMLWFVTPPIDVVPLPRPVHSIEYLCRQEEIKKRKKIQETNHISESQSERPQKIPNLSHSDTSSIMNDDKLLDIIEGLASTWKQDAISLSQKFGSPSDYMEITDDI